jgi:tetrahydromethanopterin S-methyltransferase subunit G
MAAARRLTAMKDERDPMETLVRTRILRLNAALHGIVTGMVAGIALFTATNWLVLKGGRVVGPHLSLLGQYFIGYRVSFLGSLIGFCYAFVLGFLLAYVVATLYNAFADRHDTRQRRTARGPGPQRG